MVPSKLLSVGIKLTLVAGKRGCNWTLVTDLTRYNILAGEIQPRTYGFRHSYATYDVYKWFPGCIRLLYNVQRSNSIMRALSTCYAQSSNITAFE